MATKNTKKTEENKTVEKVTVNAPEKKEKKTEEANKEPKKEAEKEPAKEKQATEPKSKQTPKTIKKGNSKKVKFLKPHSMSLNNRKSYYAPGEVVEVSLNIAASLTLRNIAIVVG